MLRVQYAQLMFFVREGYWHHAEQLCTSVMNATDDWLFRVWRGLCYDAQGMSSEAMADYRAAEPHRHTMLPARMGMYLAYKRSRDADAMAVAESGLHDDKFANDVDAWVHAAALCWASGAVHMARDILVRYQDARLLQEHRNEYTSLATVRAWVDLCSGRSALLEKCGQLFLGVLEREAAAAADDEDLLRQHFAVAAAATAEDARHGTTTTTTTATTTRTTLIDLDAALGRVAYLERKYQLYPAQELLHRVIVTYPALTLPLVVKARLLMRAEDWQQAMETVRRVLAVEPDNLEALALTALHPIVKEGRYGAAAPHLSALLTAMQRSEPRNAALLHRCAQAFSRLCATAAHHYSGNNNNSGGGGGAVASGNEASMQHLLGITRRFAEAACGLAPSNGEYLCELGMAQYYSSDYKAALTVLQRAAALTDSLSPLLGTVACHVQLGSHDAAVRQLSLCNELIAPASSSSGSSSSSGGSAYAELYALGGMLAWRVDRDETRALQLLDQAADALRRELSMQLHVGLELYTHLHLPLMLQVAREYLQHTRSEPPEPSMRQADATVQQCQRHLELLLRYVPGCAEAQLLHARVCFIAGDVAQTQSLLRHTLAQEQPLPEAFLFSAQVCHYLGQSKLARAALEQALMLDFAVRDEPYYHLLLGMVQGQLRQHDAALESLRTAMRLVRGGGGVTAATEATTPPPVDTATATTTTAAARGKRTVLRPLSVSEHVTLYLQLAQASLHVPDVDAARTTLAEAAEVFARSGQLARVTMAQAMLAAHTDVEQSIALLRQVPATSSYFVVARAQAAKLYLAQLHNPVQYIRCFEEVVQQAPTAQAYVELGEAYSTVQEPEKAIAAYERAKTLLDPRNSELAVRIGRQLVAMHDYGKAVRYYEDALAADPTLFAVRADLAMLLWHLGDGARAVQCVRDAPVLASDSAASSESSPDEAAALPSAGGNDVDGNGGRAADKMTAAMAKEDTATAIERVNCGLLLYKIHKGTHANNGGGGGGGSSMREAVAALTQARTWQLHVLNHKMHDCTRETVLQQKRILATMDTELARNYMAMMSNNSNSNSSSSSGSTMYARSSDEVCVARAREYLREALQHDEAYEEAMLTLAQLHLRVGDMDACEQQCNALLRVSPDRDDAVVLLSTVQLRRGLHDDAASLLQRLLTRHPDRHEVLVAYTRLLCRAGRLSDVGAVLEEAAAAATRPRGHGAAAATAGQRAPPGLSYARGVYLRASCDHAGALRAFNAARSPADNPWSARALAKMVNIYLVPSPTEDMWVDAWSMDEKSDNVRSAEVLLHYLPAGTTRQTLQAYCLLATKRPHDMEHAMQLLLTVIGSASEDGKDEDKSGDGGGVRRVASAAGRVTTVSPGAAAAQHSVDDEDDLLLRELQHDRAHRQGSSSSGGGGSGVDEVSEHSNNAVAGARRGRAAVARSAGSNRSSNSRRPATLAEVLQPSDGHVAARPAAAFLGLAIVLYLSQQEMAARRVLDRLLPSATTTATTAATTSSAATTGNGGVGSSIDDDDDVDVLERAQLLRAHMDVHAGALDTAQATLRAVLEQNKSCSAAWHALGALYERQQRHAEASSCYKRAWRLVNEADPAVGYRLALNYVKGGNAVRALDVCKRVLAKYPNYPRIEDDVMTVACSMLRP